MKHAGDTALDVLEPVLKQLRTLDGLREKKRGTFYRGSSAFLHFHEDPLGFFADIKEADGKFIRLSVNSTREVAALIRRAKTILTS